MKKMASWNHKYWDMTDQFYWNPKYVGMRSISQSLWKIDDDRISVPRSLVNKSGPLYVRDKTAKDHAEWLRTQEEILNHVFDITFAIAPGTVLDLCFLRPLGFSDDGPFESLGREVRYRYGWGSSENVTQQDGLFVSKESVIGVELKLGAKSSPSQILKYASLFAWEEMHTGQRSNIGLTYVLEAKNKDQHWHNCGLGGDLLDRTILEKVKVSDLPIRIQKLLSTHPHVINSVLDRMKLAAITWLELTESIILIKSGLDPCRPGDKTLINLLDGFIDQVAEQTICQS